MNCGINEKQVKGKKERNNENTIVLRMTFK
jgi:hypothetical protein